MLYWVMLLTVTTAGCLSGPNPGSWDAGVSDGNDAAVIDGGFEVIDGAIDGAIDGGQLPTCDSSGPVSVRELAAGDGHTCAVLTNGDLYCWGVGLGGQLGYGATPDIVGDNETPASVGPVALGGLCVLQASLGRSHTCVLLANNGVRCWGRNTVGELGVTASANVTSPPAADIAFTALSGAKVVQVAAGGAHTCVRLDDGNVRCFGQNGSGQIGFKAINLVAALSTNVPIGGAAVDVFAGDIHTCVRFADGTIKCWGAGEFGQLGYSSVDNALPSAASPTVAIGGVATNSSAGKDHTCVVLNEGQTTGVVRCWGKGDFGRLGNEDAEHIGDTELPSTTTALSFDAPVSQVSAGGFHTCIIVAGNVRCWGVGGNGALGYSDRTDNIGDMPSHPLRGDLVTGLGPVQQIVTGREHTCALDDTGIVRCWGRSDEGRLGHGDGRSVGSMGAPINSGTPVPVWCDGNTIPCE